jgi:hypothetical protein
MIRWIFLAAACTVIEAKTERTELLHARPLIRQSRQLVTRDWVESYGRGGGVGRPLGVGSVLGVGVGLGVEVGVGVAVAVGVAVGEGVSVGVAVAVGVGVGAANCAQYLPPVLNGPPKK